MGGDFSDKKVSHCKGVVEFSTADTEAPEATEATTEAPEATTEAPEAAQSKDMLLLGWTYRQAPRNQTNIHVCVASYIYIR